MKNNRSDIFSQLKNEDRKYGEKTGKSAVKDHQKRVKHPQSFKNMHPLDIVKMEESYVQNEDYEVV